MSNIVICLIVGVVMLACAIPLVLIPRDIYRSLKSRVVYLNNRPIGRLSNPIVYWAVLIAGILFWACILRAFTGL